MRKLLFLLPITLVVLWSCKLESNKEEQTDVAPSMVEFSEALKTKDQFFKINPNSDNTITCENGTIIYFPKNCFTGKNGILIGTEVEIKIKECYSYTEMIGERISTTTNGILLESGGMINIFASANSEELIMSEGASLTVAFPKKTSTPDTMFTFYATENSQGNVLWLEDYEFDNQIKNNEQPVEIKTSTATASDILISPYYRYYLSINRWSTQLKDHPLKNSDLTVEQYVEQSQYLSDSIIRKLAEKSQRCAIDFNIDKDGDFSNIHLTESANSYVDKATLKFFNNFPLLDIKKTNLDYDNYVDWTLGIGANYKYDKENYVTKFREKYLKNKKWATEKMNISDLDYYVCSVTNLSWINCDRFWNSDTEKTDFFVQVKSSGETKVNMVFEDINSIMIGLLVDGKYKFSNIPIGTKVKIIVMTEVNGELQTGIKKSSISKEILTVSEFKIMSIEELESQIN